MAFWEGHGKPGNFQGTAHLHPNIASGLALIGLDTSASPITAAPSILPPISTSRHNYILPASEAKSPSSEVEGRITLDIKPKGRKLDVALLTSSLDFPALFAPVLENPRQAWPSALRALPSSSWLG